MKASRGFVAFELLVAIVVVLGLSAAGYWYVHSKSDAPAPAQLTIGTTTQSETNFLSVSPTSGASPLSVTFTSTVGGSVGTESGYMLDFGDATNPRYFNCEETATITINGMGICKVPATLSHTYATSGTYVVTLHDIQSGAGISHVKYGQPVVDAGVIDRVAITVNTSDTLSVPGMSKYTDTNFGFSFWYPDSWVVTQHSIPVNTHALMGDASPKKSLTLDVNSQTEMYVALYTSPSSSITDSGGAGPLGPVSYWFDATTHTWMTDRAPSHPAGGAATSNGPADVSNNTMGGLHMLWGTSRFDTTIIPLTAHNFVVIGDGGELNATLLAKTIVATDPSVATPVGVAEQVKIIQAEKDAYTPDSGSATFQASKGYTFTLKVGQSASDGAGGITIKPLSVSGGQYPSTEVSVISASTTIEAELADTARTWGLTPDVYGPGGGVGTELIWSAKWGYMSWNDPNSQTGTIRLVVTAIDPIAQTVTFKVNTDPVPPERG